MDPNQNPPSEREWTEQEKEEFFASTDAVTGIPNGSLAAAWSESEPLTLNKLMEMHNKFKKRFPVPTTFQHGADMSRATFDELGNAVKISDENKVASSSVETVSVIAYYKGYGFDKDIAILDDGRYLISANAYGKLMDAYVLGCDPWRKNALPMA